MTHLRELAPDSFGDVTARPYGALLAHAQVIRHAMPGTRRFAIASRLIRRPAGKIENPAGGGSSWGRV